METLDEGHQIRFRNWNFCIIIILTVHQFRHHGSSEKTKNSNSVKKLGISQTEPVLYTVWYLHNHLQTSPRNTVRQIHTINIWPIKFQINNIANLPNTKITFRKISNLKGFKILCNILIFVSLNMQQFKLR